MDQIQPDEVKVNMKLKVNIKVSGQESESECVSV